MRFIFPSGRVALFLLLYLLAALLLFNVGPCAASMTYVATGSFAPADGSASETMTGNFTLDPGGLSIQSPDGTIYYPNPPTYTYDSFLLSSNNHTITKGTIDSIPMLLNAVNPPFGYTDQNVFFTNPVILERSITGQGWNHGEEYWQFTQIELDPVTTTGSNYLTFDNSGDYYPSNIHFTYDLTDITGTVSQAVYPPGEIGIGYTITTSDTQIGIVSFDATGTPIPSTVWLFGAGLAGLIGLKRKCLLG